MRSIAQQEKIAKSPKHTSTMKEHLKTIGENIKNVIYTHTYARVYNIMEE